MKKILIPILFTLLFLVVYLIEQALVGGIFAVIFFVRAALNNTFENVESFYQSNLLENLTNFLYSNMAFILIISIALSIVIYKVILHLRKETTKDVIMLQKPGLLFLITAVLFGVSTNILISFVMEFLSKLDSLGPVFKNYDNFISGLFSGNPFLLLLSVGIIAPCFEEILFRGLVFNELKKAFNPIVSLIIQALIFGIYHGNLVQGTYAAFIGLILGLVYMKSKSIIVPMLFHIGINSSSTILSWNGESSSLDLSNPVILVIGLALFIAGSVIFIKGKNQDTTSDTELI